MRQFYAIIAIFLVSGLSLFTSCSNTRYLEDNQALLVKHRVRIVSDSIEDKRKLSGKLISLSQQKPQTKFLGIARLKLSFYNLARDTSKGFNRWVIRNFGEPPAIVDSAFAAQSAETMEKLLFNKGYFNSIVGFETKIKRKKATTTYRVKRRELTKINKVYFDITDKTIRDIILGQPDKILIKEGAAYDIDNLVDERQRIHNLLRTTGYYNFSKQYIYYELDTIGQSKLLDVHVKVSPPQNDSVHHKYYINRIYIFPDSEVTDTIDQSELDTIRIRSQKNKELIDYYVVYKDLKYNPAALTGAIFFKPGNEYNRKHHQQTIGRLSELGVFRLVNVRFHELEVDDKRMLDVTIQLAAGKKQGIRLEVEGSTGSDYFLGSKISFEYQNRNLFRFADLFTFNLSTGIETLIDSSGLSIRTLDFNAGVNFYFPKFIVPFKLQVLKSFNPKTRISLYYSNFRRIDYYNLNSIVLSYGFDWKEFEPKQHILNPIEISLSILTDSTKEFSDILNENPTLRRSFEEQFIFGGNYTFIYRNKKSDEDYTFLRLRGDISGNLLSLINLTFDGFSWNGPYTFIGNRPYSQYIRPEGEYRIFEFINKKNAFVMRMFGGVGIAFGNSTVMPYIKQYVIGGPNSVRAWPVRSLGPGSYKPDISGSGFIDQTGDIKLEANIEYRYNISGILQWAAFIDVGNIWMLRDDPTKEGEDFRLNRFYREIAIGTGLGIRLDFDFFIIRLDAGYPVRDPAREPMDRWVFFKGSLRDVNLNLAIGYPF